MGFEVKFDNNSKVPTERDISIRLKNGIAKNLSYVLCVPGLHQNLLSIGQLTRKTMKFKINQGICSTYDGKKTLITKIKMSANRLFPLCITILDKNMLNTTMRDRNWLWHLRLGNVNFESLT